MERQPTKQRKRQRQTDRPADTETSRRLPKGRGRGDGKNKFLTLYVLSGQGSFLTYFFIKKMYIKTKLDEILPINQ